MSYRILLVEDNPTDALLVETALETGEAPFEFVTVERIEAARKALASDRFDAVLMDLTVPDGSGLDNLAILNAVGSRTPIIVLTGHADERTGLAAIQLGAADYLAKGATRPDLLERALRYAIERKRHENDRLELERARIARAEAEAANRAKDEFLATLSHELRTPLNAILGWASLLRTGQLGPAETHQALETIERNARVQAQLVEDLLDVSRIVTGNMRLQQVSVNLSQIVGQAVEALIPVASQKKVQLEMQIHQDPTIYVDSTRIQQVVWNLIANAVKFTPPDGRVRVEVDIVSSDSDGPEALLTVRDNGQGITPEFLPQIFDRFRQGDATPTRRHGGLGLGLAIVRNVVQMHAGRVAAESPGRGQGATFKVWLPLASDEELAEEEAVLDGGAALAGQLHSAPQAPSLQSARILAVEDDPASRDFVHHVFDRCGVDIKLAPTVPEALALVNAGDWIPDLIICDLGMPDQDGYTLLRRLRAEFPKLAHVPVAVLTAYAPDGEVERAFAAGFAAFWAKPIEPEVLCAAASVLYESTKKAAAAG